ncbi:MAG: hypothetical protein RXS42_02335 [Nitrososphaeria archaeon]
MRSPSPLDASAIIRSSGESPTYMGEWDPSVAAARRRGVGSGFGCPDSPACTTRPPATERSSSPRGPRTADLGRPVTIAIAPPARAASALRSAGPTISDSSSISPRSSGTGGSAE